MFIYSGKCRLCEVGLTTDLKDDLGNKLRTGDIVMSYTVAKDTGFRSVYGITVVVANHYDNIAGVPPTERIEENKSEPFVMGIKACDIQEPLEDYPTTVWRVHRVKEYEDIIDGEKWSDFGFNYRSDA